MLRLPSDDRFIPEPIAKPCGAAWLPRGNHVDDSVRAGFKPAPTATPIVAPDVARTIAAFHTGSWHQRQTDTSVNSAKRRQNTPISLHKVTTDGTVGAGFKPARIIAAPAVAPVVARIIAAPVATRTIAAFAIGCLPSVVSPSEYSDYAIGSGVYPMMYPAAMRRRIIVEQTAKPYEPTPKLMYTVLLMWPL